VSVALSSGMRDGMETLGSGAGVAIPVLSIERQLANSSANSRSPEPGAAFAVSTTPVICVVVAVSLAIAGVVRAMAARAPKPALKNMRPVYPSLSQPRPADRGVLNHGPPLARSKICEMVGTPRRLSDWGCTGLKVNYATRS